MEGNNADTCLEELRKTAKSRYSDQDSKGTPPEYKLEAWGCLLNRSGERQFTLRGDREGFPSLKVPRECPRVALVRVGWKEGKALGSVGFDILTAATVKKSCLRGCVVA
jgi:hypothetical protein